VGQFSVGVNSPDNQSAEYQALYPVVLEHGAGVGVAVQYVMAQLPSAASDSPTPAA
jgi:hypothetical protein